MGDKHSWFEQLQKKRRVLAEQLKDPAAVGLWKSVIDKYSDNAHFVYELLQNSDDAEASEVRVYLYPDKIEYIHNGKIAFSLSDPKLEGVDDSYALGHINSITSIGSSNKKGENKIGKFGVGFKSVFKYTDKPHVEDDNFSFDLVDYIVPVESTRVSSHRKKNETAFLFPILDYNHNIPIIRERFQTLHYPLLFLDHLKKIVVYEEETQLFAFQKNVLEEWSFDGEKCRFLQLQAPHGISWFYTFSHSVGDGGLMASCALFADEDGRLDLSPHDEPLYCYFPTREHLDLNYIVHAPFVLTENRENIKMQQEWNDKLLYETGHLFLKSLTALTQKKTCKGELVIDDASLCLFPISALFGKRNNPHLEKHASAYKNYMAETKMFLTSDHTYVSGTHTLYADDKELSNLFSATEIQNMIPNTEGDKWCFLRVTGNDYISQSDIVKFLDMTHAIHCHVDTLSVLKSLSPSLLQGKTIQWLKDFYSFLSNKKTLWKTNDALLKCLPIFYCEDGLFHAAYNQSNDPQPSIYLTSGSEHHFDAIHPSLLEYPKCKNFFEFVGVKEPGALAEILENILPLYSAHKIPVDDLQQVARHLTLISDYYHSLPFLSDERKAFLQSVRTIPFLLVKSAEGDYSFQLVENGYLNNSLLSSFLKDNRNVYFFENEFVENEILPEKRESLYAFLSAAGLHFGLNVVEVQREPTLWVLDSLNLHPASLRQVDNGAQIIVDKFFVGMEELLQNPTEERSAAFFKLLVAEIKNQTSFIFRKSLEGYYQYYEKGKRTATEEVIRQTTALTTLFHGKWLYSSSGTLVSVSDVTETSQLAPFYDFSSSDLLIFLNIKLSDDLKNLSQSQREAIEFVSQYQAKGMSIDQMRQILENYLTNHSSNANE